MKIDQALAQCAQFLAEPHFVICPSMNLPKVGDINLRGRMPQGFPVGQDPQDHRIGWDISYAHSYTIHTGLSIIRLLEVEGLIMIMPLLDFSLLILPCNNPTDLMECI